MRADQFAANTAKPDRMPIVVAGIVVFMAVAVVRSLGRRRRSDGHEEGPALPGGGGEIARS